MDMARQRANRGGRLGPPGAGMRQRRSRDDGLRFNEMTSSLRDQAERLKASYQQFATVTQSARDAIISTDERSSITFWNRSAELILGIQGRKRSVSP
jgi:PAS domain-containing protein